MQINKKFSAFFRIGSDYKLLLFDLVLVLILIIDLIKIKEYNLFVYDFYTLISIWEIISFKIIILLFVLIYAPPILICLMNFTFHKVAKINSTLSASKKNAIFLFHFAICIAFVYFLSISLKLQIYSGILSKGIEEDKFLYTPLISIIFSYTLTYLALVSIIIRPIYNLAKAGFDNVKNDWNLWFELADIANDYYPKQKHNLVYVNSASMAPIIRWISNKTEIYRDNYQTRIPTSDDARRFLIGKAEKCRELIISHLVDDENLKHAFDIEFLPGTSRALEIGLTRIDNLKKIILSPYEHPSQYDVVKWLTNRIPEISHEFIPLDFSKLENNWQTQKRYIIQSIKNSTKQINGKIAIILSEVHYKTGLFINISELIHAIRPDYFTSNFVFVIDGSQSMGNIVNPFSSFAKSLRGDDFYYFSAHKWLLSPNTCGVLIKEHERNPYKNKPYDLLGTELPTSTIEPSVVFGLCASLEFLIEDKLIYKFKETSMSLKSYFIDKIGDTYKVIHSSTSSMNISSFLAIKPNDSFKWKETNLDVFWKRIRERGLDLSVIDLSHTEEKTWWLRISFPYFLQLYNLKRLIKYLKEMVEPY